MLGLVHRIAQGKFDPLPAGYSLEFGNLLEKLLLKNDEERPTTRNVLDMPFIEKYIKDFLQSKEKEVMRSIERKAEMVANTQSSTGAKEQPMLTPKERLKLKKQEEANKKFQELSLAAKGAVQRFAE